MIQRKKVTDLPKIMMTLICVLLITLLTVFFALPMMNQIVLKSFARQLFTYELPPDTILIEEHQIYGHLVGEGNEEDYLAAILLKTELSEEKIKSYYFTGDFKNAKKEGNSLSIEIFKPNGAQAQSAYLRNESIIFTSLEGEEQLEDYIVVLIRDGGYKEWITLADIIN